MAKVATLSVVVDPEKREEALALLDGHIELAIEELPRLKAAVTF